MAKKKAASAPGTASLARDGPTTAHRCRFVQADPQPVAPVPVQCGQVRETAEHLKKRSP